MGVMHACGHDCHVAIMMAVAEILAAHRGELRGTVKLIFQPAEENLPNGEIGGRMLTEGAFNDPKPDAMFGLHVLSILPTGVTAFEIRKRKHKLAQLHKNLAVSVPRTLKAKAMKANNSRSENFGVIGFL